MGSQCLIWLTCASIVLVIYHHLGYPLLLNALIGAKRAIQQRAAVGDARVSSNAVTMPDVASEQAQDPVQSWPSMTILMPAYNEADWIADKIRNLATLDYPHEQLEVVLACDGCTDQTADIARRVAQEPWCQQLRLRVIEYPENQGKVAVLNQTMTCIDTDLVALSDVSALISYDALRLAACHFQQAQMGVVNSHYCFLKPSEEERQYWAYQNQILYREAQLGASLGAHGALYFIRRHLFTPLPLDTINDDFVLPMLIVAQGYRADVVPNIHAVELEPTNGTQNFRRRIRIGAGNYQQLLRLLGCLHPRQLGVAFTFASGKALRVLMPVLMLMALIGSALLAPFYGLFALATFGQVLIYTVAMLGVICQRPPHHPVLKALQYLVTGHCANLIGMVRYIIGLEQGRWQRVTSVVSRKC